MNHRACIAFALLLHPLGILYGQGQLIRKVELYGVRHVTVDRAGGFYAITPAGIHKYDGDGEETRQLQTPSPATLFDPANGVRLLAYFRDLQAYSIYPPNLDARPHMKLDPSFAIDPWLVCSSGDYNLVILDAADWSIKVVDTRNSVVDYEFRLDSALRENPHFVFMREYQGFLFLLDGRTGITIFNRLGMKLRTLAVAGLQSFNFLGQELYYCKDGKIHFTDLFTLQSRIELTDHPCLELALGDGRCLVLSPDSSGLAFFSYSP